MGLSFERLRQCDIDHSYVALILSGKRRPPGSPSSYSVGLDCLETDRMLILAGFPLVGRPNRTERQEPSHPA
jgi:hypothetical protein